MAREFTFDDLKQILIHRVGIPEEDIGNDMDAEFSSIGLDSLALVEIQAAVQQEYGFEISDDDAQRIITIGNAIDYTNQRLREAE